MSGPQRVKPVRTVHSHALVSPRPLLILPRGYAGAGPAPEVGGGLSGAGSAGVERGVGRSGTVSGGQ